MYTSLVQAVYKVMRVLKSLKYSILHDSFTRLVGEVRVLIKLLDPPNGTNLMSRKFLFTTNLGNELIPDLP